MLIKKDKNDVVTRESSHKKRCGYFFFGII